MLQIMFRQPLIIKKPPAGNRGNILAIDLPGGNSRPSLVPRLMSLAYTLVQTRS